MIPENLQAFARELGELAAKYELRTVHGAFHAGLHDPWRAEVQFHWRQGRHGADADVVLLTSNVSVTARIESPLPTPEEPK